MTAFRKWLVICAVLALVPAPARAGDDLADRINSIINGPNYKEAHWGILVVDAESGRTVYEHEAEKLFIPASTTKLYSCAAAQVVFGADYRFATPLYRRGEVADGRLKGDLILVAQGDLTMGGRDDGHGHMAYTDSDHIYASRTSTTTALTSTDPLAGLKDLARQVKAAGITKVDGEVLVDDRLFAHERGSGSGPGVLTPILVNDNVVDLIITPGAKAGDPATVRMHPETAYVQMDAQVTTAAEGKGVNIEVVPVGARRFVVRGQTALKAKPAIRIYPVEDPAGYARALLIETLRREGVTVTASPLSTPESELPPREGYDKLTRVAVHNSLPLSEALKVTLKVSHNLYASTLPLLIAAKRGKRTLADGLRAQRVVLSDLGMDAKTISFGGGAGGANADRTTPRATVQLLQAMAKRPDYAAYRDGLPILGVDGTLADVVPADSPARGKVFAKTGTLFWTDLMNGRDLLTSKALAGTMTTAKGRTLFVALFVNDVPLPALVGPSREGKVLGQLCEIIYQHVP